MRNRNGYLFAGIALAACVIAGIFLWERHQAASAALAFDAAQAVDAANAAASSTVPATTALTATTNLYQNAAFHFALAFPNALSPRQYSEAGDAMSVTFEDLGSPQEFQIYATPYAQDQITPERFKLDEPSGVRDDPTDVMIDGVRATMFFSSNPVMGDTREVWFIHGGFLYEVVTEKANDAWLANIMQSWKFLP